MIPLAAIMSIGEKVLDKVLPDPEARANNEEAVHRSIPSKRSATSLA